MGRSRLRQRSHSLVASDGHPDYPATVGDNMAIALSGRDVGRIFNNLAEGGGIQMPLAKQPWGAIVGRLKDKFGINWAVTINQA